MNKQTNSAITRFSGVLLTLICFVAITGSAHAAFIAYICDDALCSGGGDTIVTDQGLGDNFPGSAAVGQINSGALSVGGFIIVTNVAQSNPFIGSSSQPQLALTFTAVTSDSSTHTVYLYASNTGFTGSAGTAILSFGGTQPAGTNSVSATAYGGTSNTNLDLTNALSSSSSISTSPFAFRGTTSFSPSVNPYGLTIGVKITRAGPGTTTGDLNFVVTPTASAPDTGGSALLMSLGLIALLGVARALRRNGRAPVS